MSRAAVAQAVRPRLGRVVLTGIVATVVAAAVTTAGGALAKAAGVDFEIPDGGESIPVAGFTSLTTMLSLAGVAMALGLARWSPRPAAWFVRVAVTLTAVSLVPPLVVGASAATALALIALHLVAAAVMIPALARALR